MNMDIEESSLKWMVVRLEKCSGCRRQVRHNVGVHYPNGVEEHIKECLKCHEVSKL